jgi:drug/metabolite transporter (DMT)-like permease
MPLVILLYAMFASVFTISKTGLAYTEPFFFVGTRMLLAGIIMLSYQVFFKKEKIFSQKMPWVRLFCLSFFNIYLTNTCEFLGLKDLTSFKTCFFYSLSPFLSALFSYFIFSERMGLNKWIGLVIGFLGLLPIMLQQKGAENISGELFFFSWPELFVMTAATSSVLGWIFLRQLINENGYSPFVANGISMFVGGAFALTHSYFVENWNPIPVTEFLPFFECALLLLIISNLICYNLYGFLMKTFSATFMSLAGFSTPLFSALFGFIFLGEEVTWPFYLSLFVVFTGSLIFYQEELKVGSLNIKES